MQCHWCRAKSNLFWIFEGSIARYKLCWICRQKRVNGLKPNQSWKALIA